MTRRMAIGAATIVLVALLLYSFGRGPTGHSASDGSTPQPVQLSPDDPAAPLAEAAASRPSRLAPQNAADNPPPEADDEAFATWLRERFGKTINHGHTQIKALEKLMAYLMKHYPDDWQSRVYDLLMKIFPERADELYAKFKKLVTMNDWLAANRHELMQMGRRDRREALWDKRFEIFGDEANQIWEVARKNDKVLERLDEIAESKDTTIRQKLDMYVGAITDAYGDQTAQLLERRTTELMNSFLSLESVAEELRALPPEQRREELRTIRRAMGMDDAAIERWDGLDSERDAAWQRGEEYMRQRQTIVDTLSGEEQATRLAELQEKTFGDEAETIREEENAAFFRYGRPRRIGRE